MRGFLTPRRLAVTGLVLLTVAVAALFVVPDEDTYIFLPDEAHAVAPLVAVEGGRTQRDGGGIYFVDVIVRKATLFERLFPSVREGAALVPGHALNPAGVSERVRRRGNLRQMSRSQLIAAAVALRELGYRVRARPAGAFISQLLPGTPAAEALELGDVVVGVDGEPVRTPDDLRRLVERRPPGLRVRLRLRRDGVERTISVRTILRGGRTLVGVGVEPEADVELPISVRIDAGDVGGPSAGLAFALAILEKLGRDVDHGYKVAATGELELDGSIEAVGGVEQKTIGAERADVDIFLVPVRNAGEAGREADSVRVVPVRTFQHALRALATLAPAR